MASGQNKIGWCPTMLRTLFVLIVLIPGPSFAQVQDGAPGLTKRTIFRSFNPHAPVCRSPSGLRRALTYVQENEREFLQGLNHGLSLAARDRGLEYNRVVVENDVAKAIEQLRLLKASKVGAVIGTSSDPIAISHSLQEVIWSGAFVGTVIPPPATLLLNAPQYATGKVLTDAAIAHINAKLGGKARVVLLTQDN